MRVSCYLYCFLWYLGKLSSGSSLSLLSCQFLWDCPFVLCLANHCIILSQRRPGTSPVVACLYPKLLLGDINLCAVAEGIIITTFWCVVSCDVLCLYQLFQIFHGKTKMMYSTQCIHLIFGKFIQSNQRRSTNFSRKSVLSISIAIFEQFNLHQ